MKEIMKIVGVVALCNTPMYVGVLAQDANPIVLEERSVEGLSVDTHGWTTEVARLDAEVSAVWAELGLLGGLRDRVDTIEEEMLNVDRYETICSNDEGIESNYIFKHHYDSTTEVEYWHITNTSYNSWSTFGSYENLKANYSWLNCNWW